MVLFGAQAMMVMMAAVVVVVVDDLRQTDRNFVSVCECAFRFPLLRANELIPLYRFSAFILDHISSFITFLGRLRQTMTAVDALVVAIANDQ